MDDVDCVHTTLHCNKLPGTSHPKTNQWSYSSVGQRLAWILLEQNQGIRRAPSLENWGSWINLWPSSRAMPLLALTPRLSQQSVLRYLFAPFFCSSTFKAPVNHWPMGWSRNPLPEVHLMDSNNFICSCHSSLLCDMTFSQVSLEEGHHSVLHKGNYVCYSWH